jgi:hypothetical protein
VEKIATTLPTRSWNRISAGKGAKGERLYDWAWVRITPPADEAVGHHWLLIRANITTGERAYYRCWSPTRVGLKALVRVAGTRWSVEECLCATRRPVVFPTQLGGTRREVPGSDGLPGAERLRGQEHARKPVVVPRRMGRGAGGPA